MRQMNRVTNWVENRKEKTMGRLAHFFCIKRGANGLARTHVWETLTSPLVHSSNGNDIETNANVSFDNGIFFDIEAKRTRSVVRKLLSKRSERIR
jgi:hypothetical protein